MSGYSDDALIRSDILHADAVFLQKPFGPEILLGKVETLLKTSAG